MDYRSCARLHVGVFWISGLPRCGITPNTAALLSMVPATSTIITQDCKTRGRPSVSFFVKTAHKHKSCNTEAVKLVPLTFYNLKQVILQK